MAKIFLSYRREDTSAYAGRLCDHLGRAFGRESVFMDVQDIRPGQDFAHAIEETVARCDAVVVVIGPRWLPSLQERRSDGEDFVREEVGAALRSSAMVVPVLVAGAPMPSMRELPKSLEKLSRLQALSIRDDSFEEDTARLVDVIGSSPAGRTRRRWLTAALAGVGATAVLGAYLALRPETPNATGRWIAEMHKNGQRPFRIGLNLKSTDRSITGSVDFPTGTAAIRGGRLDGKQIRFETVHTPDFAAEPATHQFEGEFRAGELHLECTNVYGTAKGVATRVP
jgi:hypothetical protein